MYWRRALIQRASLYLYTVIEDGDASAGTRPSVGRSCLRVWQMEEQSREEAAELLEEAGELAAENDLPELEVFALKASLDLLNRVDNSKWINMALEQNPHLCRHLCYPCPTFT